MKIGKGQRDELKSNIKDNGDLSGSDTAQCKAEYCLAIKIYKGALAPTYPSEISICVAVFWEDEASKHASDRCNLYVVPVTRTFPWKRGAEEVFEIAITEAEYSSNRVTLFLWSDPPATATFRESGGDTAAGRLKLTESRIVHKGQPTRASTFEFEILFEAEILESPVFHLIELMHKNQSHPAVLDMKAWPSGKKNDVMTTLGFPADFKDREAWYIPYGKILQGGWEAVGDPSYAENISEFDLKPEFARVWGTRCRIENNERVYFYDVWSNLHYGFIGNAAGFSAEDLNKLAAQDPAGDSTADQHATVAGWEMYQSMPASAREGSLLMKQKALYEKILSVVRADDLFLDQKYYQGCKEEAQKRGGT